MVNHCGHWAIYNAAAWSKGLLDHGCALLQGCLEHVRKRACAAAVGLHPFVHGLRKPFLDLLNPRTILKKNETLETT
jgi:hypothetical protein